MNSANALPVLYCPGKLISFRSLRSHFVRRYAHQPAPPRCSLVVHRRCSLFWHSCRKVNALFKRRRRSLLILIQSNKKRKEKMKLLPILLGSAVAQSQNDILDMKKRSFLQEIELDAILQLQVKKNFWQMAWKIFLLKKFFYKNFRTTSNSKISTSLKGSLKASIHTEMIIQRKKLNGERKLIVSSSSNRILEDSSGKILQ